MKAQENLYYLVYTSHESYPLTRRDLRDIMDQAEAFNQQRQITGMLVYRAGPFLQVLEGQQNHIAQLYDSICRDRRHHQIQLVIMEPATQRCFSEWSMGFCDLACNQDRERAAYTIFLREGLCARIHPSHPSIPASLLTMFVYDFSGTTAVLH